MQHTPSIVKKLDSCASTCPYETLSEAANLGDSKVRRPWLLAAPRCCARAARARTGHVAAAAVVCRLSACCLLASLLAGPMPCW